MIGILVEPYERVTVRTHVAHAKRQRLLPPSLRVAHLRTPSALLDSSTTLLAVKHTLLQEPSVQQWCAQAANRRLIGLWSQPAHPQTVFEVVTRAPTLWATAVYEDFRRAEFWQRVHAPRPARAVVADVAQQLLADAGAWQPEARPLLQRLVLNLHCPNVQQIAAMLYAGTDPVHTLRRRLRDRGCAPPKTLLFAAQLTAWRAAVDAGVGAEDAARAVGRDSAESWRRSVRDALGNGYRAYIQREIPVDWYIRQCRHLYRAHGDDPLASASVAEVFVPPNSAA